MPDFKIEIRENGPMRVYGPFELVDQQGEIYTDNKPFCDGTHRTCEFEAESKAH